jgi:putative solute:sodium symporter small subunit
MCKGFQKLDMGVFLRMKSPYRKECKGTVIFFLLFLVMGHTGLWFAPFAKDLNIYVLGFPLHYFVAIFLGWIGLLVVSLFYVKWADRVDEEIEDYNDEVEDDQIAQAEVKMDAINSTGGVKK